MSPDYVIVTVRTVPGTFEADYELPAALPAERLSRLLLEGLAQQSPKLFGAWQGLRLSCGGRMLEDRDTLSALGIWDGSILTIEEVKKCGI